MRFTGLTTIATTSLLMFSGAQGVLADEARTLTLEASSLKALSIAAGAGQLSVKGVSGSDQIMLDATLNGIDVDDDDYELTLEKKGDSAFIVAKTNQRNTSFFNRASIDVLVTMPAGLSLSVEDGSGDIRIENIANSLLIHDGSGDIRVEGVKADVSLHDGSGSVTVTNIEGDLDMHDGSGDIEMEDIAGNVTLTDGSGEININQVNGDVELTDGSGDLEVTEVSGTVYVTDASGDILVDTARSFTLARDGSGRVQVRNVEQQNIDDW